MKEIKIAFIGVDGTGKSTIANILKNKLDEKIEIQHMGANKSAETKFRKYIVQKKKDNVFFKILSGVSLYYDRWYRVIKNERKKGVIIYDRHPLYNPTDARKFKRILDKVIYSLMPMPHLIYYFYCDVNTSIQRKPSEFESEYSIIELKRKKKIFDYKYLKNKNIKKINTDQLGEQQIIQMITNDFKNNG